MRLFDRFKRKSSTPDNNYEGLRQQALNMEPEVLGVTLDTDEQVYAAIVDMPTGNNIATLVCFIDGSVSLYFSNGDGFSGLGQKYEDVRSAGTSLLISTGQAIPYLSMATSFDLQKSKKARIFLLVRSGVYCAEFDMNNIQSYEKHVQFLNFLIQNVLSKIRKAAL